MTRSTSFFLDWLRVVAAATVFIEHCIFFWDPQYFAWAARLAHAAVIVFFVLSGYVIAHATWSRENTVRSYVLARLSRLYSVLVPALLLAAVAEVAGHALNPDFALFRSRGHEALRYLSVAGFVQSNWTWFTTPLSNMPFWSLSYEFWYYAMFGAAVLLPRGRTRWLGVGATLFIMGPDILLLLPCWLVGVGAYLWRERLLGGVVAARVGLALSVAASGLALVLMPDWPGRLGYAPWWFSNTFVSDWVLSLGVGAAVLCFNAGRFPVPPRAVFEGVRWGAGHTFSLYLFHFPILAFIRSTLHLERPPLWQQIVAAAVTLLAVLALSTFTEAKRRAWHQGFARLWDALAQRPSSAPSEPAKTLAATPP